MSIKKDFIEHLFFQEMYIGLELSLIAQLRLCIII